MAKSRQETRRQMYLPSPTSEVHYHGKDDGCCGIFYLKHVLYVFNVILVLSGCVVLVVGLWTLFLKQSFVSLLTSNIFTITTYLLIVTGGIIIVLVFTLGCIAACRENPCLLMTFAVLLMLVLLLEAVVGVMAYLYEAVLTEELVRNLNATMLSSHRVDEEKTKTIDEMQQLFRCCGASNYTDWYYRPNSTVATAAESESKSCASYASDAVLRPDWVFSSIYDDDNANLAIPESCCLSPCRGCTRRTHPSNIFTEGCIASLEQYFGDHLIIIGAVGLGLCCLEVFGIIFSCCLAKKIKQRKERQKTYWR